ncbi:MAG: RyR domain-containing protein [Dehalococcoidales bacterium]
MNKKTDTKTILVAGDVTIDWNIARMRRKDGAAQAWTADEVTAACCQPGGAAMLADLINAVAKNLKQTAQVNFNVREVNLPHGRISPTDNRFHHSYAMWTPLKLNERNPALGEVWRVEEFLGLNPIHAGAGSGGKLERVEDGLTAPDILVLDDANLGFRDAPDLWPKVLSIATARPWILVKIAKPVAQGKLWENLHRKYADRVIAILTAGDLRSSQVQISRQLSWERTAQDLVWELVHNPHVNTLAECKHVIVTFSTAGAILLSRKENFVTEATLFFDPYAMEGEWGRDHKGYIVGYNSCLTAGIARELMLNSVKPDVSKGIQSGIAAMRFLHIEGYGKVTGSPGQMHLTFPAQQIAEVLAENVACLATAQIKALPTMVTDTALTEGARYWTILEDKNTGSLEAVSEQIVREGLECALPDVPMGSFGNLKTVDRKEIESLHSISTLIREYAGRYQPTPFSIAVFGPPGSGKSFSVREVASSVLPGQIMPLSFNVSQFTGSEDLYNAFHQVRDVTLSGKMPLVFWDEFDTTFEGQELGWLRYFLAPMDEGKFCQGQITHPIGRCIFVFAGATSHSMEAFSAKLDEQRAAKLPDFISRLKGFLNILGPNRQIGAGSPMQNTDPYYIIRRAIILRSDFERFTPHLLDGKKTVNIDQGVLRAFLTAREYRHGARSIEAIIAMSQLAGKRCFERSCLPSELQLGLHVNGPEFYAIIHGIELGNDIVEKLAEVSHEIFCDDLRAKHFKYAPVSNKRKKEHSSLRPYSELPEDEKEQNRNNVRDILDKLASIRYKAVQARDGGVPGNFTVEQVEKLAEMEHIRWMKQKRDAGWKYARRTNKARMLHQDLLPWEKLPESEKEKDRVLVEGIPKILSKAGYMMAQV